MTNNQLEHLYEMLEEMAVEYAIGERKELAQWNGGIEL